MQTSMGVDIRRIVQEELALRDMKEKHASQVTARENKDQEESNSSEEWPSLEKNQKIQKKNKTEKPKKIERFTEAPPEGTDEEEVDVETVRNTEPEKDKIKNNKKLKKIKNKKK